MFYEQLNEICKQRGTTPSGLLRKLGLSTSKVSAWKRGSTPKAAILERLAHELDVSVDVFFGENSQTISEDENELLTVFRSLSKPWQRQLMGKAYEMQVQQGQVGDTAKIAPPDLDLAPARVVSTVKK